MKEKKLFSFQLEAELKEKMKVITQHRARSMGYFINEALVQHIKTWEERLKQFDDNKKD